jgi:excisionase family DNA binding protein
MKEPLDQELLSPAEVAMLLNVPYRTVILWVKNRKIPSYKLGRHLRVEKEKLLEWVRQNSSQA